MDYTDAQREATFVGAVRIDGLSGNARSQRAVVFLTPAKSGASTAAAPFGGSGGSVDHLVLNGDVQLEQPGRRATGETLLYTAANGRYVAHWNAGASAAGRRRAAGYRYRHFAHVWRLR